MSTAADTTSELYKATVARLASRPLSGPEWLQGVRARASNRFRAQGLPTPKHESWRFTPLRPLVRHAFGPDSGHGHPVPQHRAALDSAGALGALRVVVDNGVPTLPAEAPPGLRVFGLARALDERPDIVETHLGRHDKAESDGFAAQNAALFEDALVLIVERRTVLTDPVHVVFAAASAEQPVVSYPRLLVVVEEGAELRLVESHVSEPGAVHLENSVVEVVLERDARLDHVRIVHGKPHAFSVATLAAHQGAGSHYASRVFTLGGALSRLDLAVTLDGQGAEATLDGLYLAGSEEVVDHHTLIRHAAPHGSSREKYKGIVDGNGQAVFDGIIEVARGAQKTSAHQESRSLQLSADAVVHTKPHLEIDADDVQCSHGATVGRLDETALFYLRSRGLDLETARATLTYAFAREMVDRAQTDAVRRHLVEAVLGRLPGGELAREVA